MHYFWCGPSRTPVPTKLSFTLPLVGEGLARNPQNSRSLVSGNPTRSRRAITTLLYFGTPHPPQTQRLRSPFPKGKAALSGTSCHLSQRARLTAWRIFATLFVGTGVLDCPHKNDVTFLWNTSSVNLSVATFPKGKANNVRGCGTALYK